MVAKVGGVFGTLRHPHLIQPYLAYYDHMASHYGGPWAQAGVPLYLDDGAIKKIYRYLSRLYIIKKTVYRVLVCSLWEFTIQSRPHTIF